MTPADKETLSQVLGVILEGGNFVENEQLVGKFNLVMKNIQAMPTTASEDVMDLRMEMIASLLESISKAGGSIPWSRLKKMTVQEVVDTLAQNGIRFHYNQNGVAK